MWKLIKRLLFTSGLIVLPVIVQAATAPAWQIVPNASSIRFTATQNNAPVTGKFTKFTADIHFDPAQLDSSSATIVVDINSISTAYPEVADTLKTADWFDAKLFPQAKFITNRFVKTAANTYQAQGNLTIRDKTLPITLIFTIEKYSATELDLQGSTSLQRTQFSLGKGDWAKTDAVKDDVKVNFVIQATKTE